MYSCKLGQVVVEFHLLASVGEWWESHQLSSDPSLVPGGPNLFCPVVQSAGLTLTLGLAAYLHCVVLASVSSVPGACSKQNILGLRPLKVLLSGYAALDL